MDRVILHCDCNAYFASVETIKRPELARVPMAVCGDPKSRHGVILAKNELAKAYGITTAETVWQAQRKCPRLVLVVPHHDEYQRYCRKINAIYEQYTDQVEAFSIDESWLDVTGSTHLFGSGKEIADTLRHRVREELGLTISVGVSYNKVFAKMGSDYKKPDATTEITRENYQSLLWPLPARALLFVGKSSGDILNRANIDSIGDIARAGRERMRQLMGGRGGDAIWEYAMGLDESPVRHAGDTDPAKSVGCGVTFSRNLCGWHDVTAGLTMLCDQVATRLRQQGMYAKTVQVQIRDPQFVTINRQRTGQTATNTTKEIFDISLDIVKSSWSELAPIRMLTITATGLTDVQTVQIGLFEDLSQREKNEKLDAAVDHIRQRFGADAVTYGTQVKNDILHTEDDEEK